MQTSAPQEINQTPAFRLPSIIPLSLIIELLIVIGVALVIARPYADFSPNMRMYGNEAEYLMSSAQTAYQAYHKLGYLPLWQPWLEKGEPLVSSPFSLLLNPVSSWPSFFLGGTNGLKLSMMITLVISGLGGWVLGRVLGFRSVARVLLGVLCVARGSMHGVLEPGFFPFTMSQSYLPWILAGMLGVLWFRRKRWPVIMTAIMFNLMIWVGLIWYVPAVVLALTLLALVHCVAIRIENVDGRGRRFAIALDRLLIRRVVFTALLTAGLSAITMIPLLSFRNNVGVSSVTSDLTPSLSLVIDVYFNGIPKTEFNGLNFGAAYYSFISPWWFIGVLTVGVLLTSFMKRLRPGLAYPPMLRWVIVIGVFLIIFYTLWGAGINPLINWSYTAIPLATSFRHVQRVLAIGAFWISILMAMAVDYMWVQLLSASWFRKPTPGMMRFMRQVQVAILLGLVLASGVATQQVLAKWFVYGPALTPEVARVDLCSAWLRKTNGDLPVAVWSRDYSEMSGYVRHEIRHFNIATDFYKPSPIASTLYMENISEAKPLYGSTWGDWDNTYNKALGFVDATGIADDVPGRPCFYKRADYYPYAFTVDKETLTRPESKLTPAGTVAVDSFRRNYDRIAVIVDGVDGREQVLTITELAFPGWTVEVNGSPAKLDVVGGYIAAVVPARAGEQRILFQYRPWEFYVGAAIMLFTWVICLLYLLAAERLIPEAIREAALQGGREAASRVIRPLLNPNLIGTEEVAFANVFAQYNDNSVKMLPAPAEPLDTTDGIIIDAETLPINPSEPNEPDAEMPRDG